MPPEPSEGRKWHRLVSAAVREACEPWRIQAQEGPFAIINRATLPILCSRQDRLAELVAASMPSVVCAVHFAV